MTPFSNKFNPFNSKTLKTILASSSIPMYGIRKGVTLSSSTAQSFVKELKSWAKKQKVMHFSYFCYLPSSWTLIRNSFPIKDLEKSFLIHKPMEMESLFQEGKIERGYLTWDASLPPFLSQNEDLQATLFLPALFYSEDDQALDQKIPFLRSCETFDEEISRLFKLCNIEKPAHSPYMKIEIEGAISSILEERQTALYSMQQLSRQLHSLKKSVKKNLFYHRSDEILHAQFGWFWPSKEGKNVFCAKEGNLFFSILETAMIYSLYEHKELIHISRKDLSVGYAMNEDGFTLRGISFLEDPAFFLSIVQAAIADSLHLILDEIADAVSTSDKGLVSDCIFSILKRRAAESKIGIDEYAKTGFSPDLFSHFLHPKTIRAFENILSENELHIWQKRHYESYTQKIKKQLQQALELCKEREGLVQHISTLEKILKQSSDVGEEIQAKIFFELGEPTIHAIRRLLK